MPNSWADADELAVIFARFVRGDPLAQSELIAAVLDPIVNHLQLRRSNMDEHMRITAAEDAVLSLLRNPTQYDETKSNLIAFLCMAAERDLMNVLAREDRHYRNRESGEFVELLSDGRNAFEEDDVPSFDDPSLTSVIDSFNDIERRVFELMRCGERRTSAFLEAMSNEALSAEDCTAEVKRIKDRIIKRLQRAGRKP